MFEKKLMGCWGDMDFNTHMRKTAFMDKAAGWLDLNARKLIAPPAALPTTWQILARTDDFQELNSSIK